MLNYSTIMPRLKKVLNTHISDFLPPGLEGFVTKPLMIFYDKRNVIYPL